MFIYLFFFSIICFATLLLDVAKVSVGTATRAWFARGDERWKCPFWWN